MTISPQQKKVALVTAALSTVALAIVAIVVAIRLGQIGTEPVAPTAPKSLPKAQGVVPTPGADSARQTWLIAQGPTLTPTPTPTVSCTKLDIPGGTSRPANEQIRFLCVGTPSAQVAQCRFRFGDGSAEVIDDDCNTLHSFGAQGRFAVSCEVKDQSSGAWRASSACDGSVEIVSGPTATATPRATGTPKATGTPGPTATPIPTVSQAQLPEAGSIGQTAGVIFGGLAVIVLGLLLLL